MRWWRSGPSGGCRRVVESVRGGVLRRERRENCAQRCLDTSPADAPVATSSIEVFVGVSRRTGQKALYSLSSCAASDQRWIGAKGANRSALYRE